MGKINKSGIEIIPLTDNGVNNVHKSMAMQRMPYISDPTIVPRVQKYLESNIDKTYVDINVMADELQRKYREYAKRKRSAFRASVKKAYSIVLQSYGLEEPESASDEDVLSDDSERDNFADNTMNNQFAEMYRRHQGTAAVKPKQIDENELIDISSDDSADEAFRDKVNKSTNGPSTSQKELPPVDFEMREEMNQKQVQPAPVSRKRKLEATISPIKPVQKKKKSAVVPFEPVVYTFKDIGGIDKTLEDICKLLLHIKHPELYRKIGISPPRGFLLHGPPGCGKTLLANAISGELGVPMIKVAAPELVAGVSGESEERIRELFERAVSSAPCILFIDEIDAITPNRQNAQKEMERRIVAQLLSCLDELSNNENGDMVLVIGATNRPDAIDPALRRAGRFDREICLGIPDLQARAKILKVLTAGLKLADDVDFESIAKYTPGYVGADLKALAREAAMIAVNRIFNDLKEHRKIQQALAQQTAAEALRNPNKKPKLTPETAASLDGNKSDAEIIVDDEVSKEPSEVAAVAPSTVEPDASDNSVVVVDLDDDVPAAKEPDIVVDGEVTPVVVGTGDDVPVVKEAEVASEEIEVTVNGDGAAPVATETKEVVPEVIETEESQAEPEAEPMKIDQRQLSTLEELMTWLHDKQPVDDEELKNLYITMEDFGKAMKLVQPSAKREGFATVPGVTWDDVGSLRDVREELQMAILGPVRHAEQFEALGLSVPAGVLLCGPPGCGKTLLAKAVANEAGVNFISVKGPELLNMYVGESERAVRVCFERARNSAPCVIFFDELDALCPKRSDSREGGATMRVVNQMLTEMDGLETRKEVFVLAASNRPDIIDPAVLRPGRLDKILYVGLPSPVGRVEILKALTKNGTKPVLAPDVDLETIGKSEQCRGYTGADLAALVREAGIVALREFMRFGESQKPLMVTTEHFNSAVLKIRPSVPEKDQKHYEKLRKMYTAAPEDTGVEEMDLSPC